MIYDCDFVRDDFILGYITCRVYFWKDTNEKERERERETTRVSQRMKTKHNWRTYGEQKTQVDKVPRRNKKSV